jgi:hypothetical protein
MARSAAIRLPAPARDTPQRTAVLASRIEPGAPGGLIVYSHAQDDNLKCKDYVLRQLGMEPFRPRPPNGAANSNQKIVTTYDYTDTDGKLLYQVVRYDPKDFKHRSRMAREDGYGRAAIGSAVSPARFAQISGWHSLRMRGRKGCRPRCIAWLLRNDRGVREMD